MSEYLINSRRRIIRSPINPLDKSTIVSIYPKEINEVKPTLEPGRFHIDAAKPDDIAILVVGSSCWWKDIDPEQPLLEITVSSIQVADSVIRDYANGLFMCDMNNSMPGLFFTPGEFSKEKILENWKVKIEEMKGKQKNWFANLVKAADILWARSNGNPISISDDMRFAAQELNLKDKPWMKDFTTITLINCKFCGSLIKPGFPVCQICHHVIDEVAYKLMKPQVA